jgi:energy-coupling factor transporter ATP-binding protein EcfA2
MLRKGFYAYGSEPSHCGEFIEEAINKINKSGQIVNLRSWKQLEIGGHLLITTILREIDDSDFVCADITGLNENVLFELGFAIGKRKPVWITQDVSETNMYNKYKEFSLLGGVAYANYTKSDHIVAGFLTEKVYAKTEVLLDHLLTEYLEPTKKAVLLYLKSQHDTDYNQYISTTIENYNLPCIIDDANEVKVQPLSWYLGQLMNIPSVLVEFSPTSKAGFEIQNAKCAFIAGIALGLNLKVQMIVAKPYPDTIDYQEFLKKFTNLDLCKKAVSPFLLAIKNDLGHLIQKPVLYSKRRESDIQKIKFGEYIAEHESNTIYEYYVNTAHQESIIKSEYNIVVGRKGSGKTATLYYLKVVLGKDIRNEVITIKPMNFEIDGLVELLKKLKNDFETGFIIQAIWKFLIYSEIAKHIYSSVAEKPLYALDVVDKQIMRFVEKNSAIILTDFSTRLENELIKLDVLESVSEQSEFRQKISEILHENIIKELKDLIISYMSKRKRLVVLIDNLDKNWRKGSNIEMVSKFILGLLGVIGRMAKELKGSPKKPNDFDLNLVIFLRSDIFKNVLLFAREPDKIEFMRLRWDDEETLFRVLTKRLEWLSDNGEKISTMFWEKYVTKYVDGHSPQDFIMSSIIPRPRDLIYFLSSAKNSAVSRGHDVITDNDLVFAYEDYSNWVFKTILVENGITIEELKTFLYNLLGEKSILTKEQIVAIMQASNIDTTSGRIDYFVNHLCALSFLGREVRPAVFKYEYDFETDEKVLSQAEKLNSGRYKIHNAFMPYLECSDYIR